MSELESFYSNLYKDSSCDPKRFDLTSFLDGSIVM